MRVPSIITVLALFALAVSACSGIDHASGRAPTAFEENSSSGELRIRMAGALGFVPIVANIEDDNAPWLEVVVLAVNGRKRPHRSTPHPLPHFTQLRGNCDNNGRNCQTAIELLYREIVIEGACLNTPASSLNVDWTFRDYVASMTDVSKDHARVNRDFLSTFQEKEYEDSSHTPSRYHKPEAPEIIARLRIRCGTLRAQCSPGYWQFKKPWTIPRPGSSKYELEQWSEWSLPLPDPNKLRVQVYPLHVDPLDEPNEYTQVLEFRKQADKNITLWLINEPNMHDYAPKHRSHRRRMPHFHMNYRLSEKEDIRRVPIPYKTNSPSSQSSCPPPPPGAFPVFCAATLFDRISADEYHSVRKKDDSPSDEESESSGWSEQ